MAEDRTDLAAYVRQVRESTQQYAKDLLAQNEKLAALVVSLRSEVKALEEDLANCYAREKQTDELRAAIDTLISERVRLTGQLSSLRDQLAKERDRQRELVERLAGAAESTQSLRERYASMEQRSATLADLFVASHRIHASPARKEVLSAIREAIVEIVGSEEFAVFELADDGSSLRVATSLGIGPEDHASSTKIAEALVRGITHVPSDKAPPSSRRRAPLACVPLRIEGRIVGAIVIFRLSQHKARLESLDQEVLDLLATHAASALYCSGLHAHMASKPRERR